MKEDHKILALAESLKQMSRDAFRSYIIQARVDSARKLLRQSGRPVWKRKGQAYVAVYWQNLNGHPRMARRINATHCECSNSPMWEVHDEEDGSVLYDRTHTGLLNEIGNGKGPFYGV